MSPFNMDKQRQNNKHCSFKPHNYASQQVEMISSSRIKVCAPFMNDVLLGEQIKVFCCLVYSQTKNYNMSNGIVSFFAWHVRQAVKMLRNV